MIRKLLITSMIVILTSLGTANAQTNAQPIAMPTEEISIPPIIIPPIFPPPTVTNWPFLTMNCVPRGAWCYYLANTTFGVALGYYLGLPFKVPHAELKGVRAECSSTKSFNRCNLYYDFPDPSAEKPFFLAVCIDYFDRLTCSQIPIRTELESLPTTTNEK